VKSYQESDSFYPAGYTTTKGRQMPPKRQYLAERACITTDGKWYIKTKAGTWDYISSVKVVANAITQSWVGGPLNITPEDIHKFINDDPPIVRGAMSVPTSASPCVVFQGGRFINTWQNHIPARLRRRVDRSRHAGAAHPDHAGDQGEPVRAGERAIAR
jgi:hypothetical protein